MIVKPLLPTADKILPYLRRIDQSRDYCNFGQLNSEYQERLGNMFSAPVITFSSATAGITASLLALGLKRGSFVACPSWTFCATPLAIIMAGHIPYFVDCNENGKVTEDILQTSLDRKKIDAAIIVSPCGAPIEIPDMNIPIVADSAGGFDTVKAGNHLSVVSTHGTKVFGTGEGGFVICKDKNLLERVRSITNFGMNEIRQVEILGFNAKLSEYHAAVGLAELDGWADKREKYLRKTKIYGLNYATSLVAVEKGHGRNGVYGCHMHESFKDYPRTLLPITEMLMNKTSFVSVYI